MPTVRSCFRNINNQVIFDNQIVSYSASRKWLGLFDRSERWSLSWRGWLILGFILVLAGALFLKGGYPRVPSISLAVFGQNLETARMVSATSFALFLVAFGITFLPLSLFTYGYVSKARTDTNGMPGSFQALMARNIQKGKRDSNQMNANANHSGAKKRRSSPGPNGLAEILCLESAS